MARNSAGTVPATGENLEAGIDQLFGFTVPVGVCRVHLSPTAPDKLYGAWNATGVDTTTWDFILEAGDAIQSPPGSIIKQVALYSDTDQTWKLDFAITGYLSGIMGN